MKVEVAVLGSRPSNTSSSSASEEKGQPKRGIEPMPSADYYHATCCLTTGPNRLILIPSLLVTFICGDLTYGCGSYDNMRLVIVYKH